MLLTLALLQGLLPIQYHWGSCLHAGGTWRALDLGISTFSNTAQVQHVRWIRPARRLLSPTQACEAEEIGSDTSIKHKAHLPIQLLECLSRARRDQWRSGRVLSSSNMDAAHESIYSCRSHHSMSAKALNKFIVVELPTW